MKPKKNLILKVLVVSCLLITTAVSTSFAETSYSINYWYSSSGGITAYFGKTSSTHWNYSVKLTYDNPSNTPDLAIWPQNHWFDAWCVSPQYAGTVTNASLVLDYSILSLKKADWMIVQNNFVKSAALQVAVWEAAIDGFDGLGIGYFQYSADVTIKNTAQSYLDAMNTKSSSFWDTYKPITGLAWDGSLTQGTNGNYYQDYLIKPVPEPSTLFLIGTGLLGVGVIARFRRKRKV